LIHRAAAKSHIHAVAPEPPVQARFAARRIGRKEEKPIRAAPKTWGPCTGMLVMCVIAGEIASEIAASRAIQLELSLDW